MWKHLRSFFTRKDKSVSVQTTDQNTCLLVAVGRASITRACQTQRSASLSREKGDFYLTKRGATTINRACETTKRRVLLPRELLDTLLANGSRRPPHGLLFLCCWKNRRSPRNPVLFPLPLSIFPRGSSSYLPEPSGLFFISLFRFILFYSFSRCQEHDMIGNIDYL